MSQSILILLGACLLSATVATAKPIPQPNVENSLHPLLFVQEFGQVAISLDGKSLAWVEMQIDKQGGITTYQDIYLGSTNNLKKPIQLVVNGKKGHFYNNGISWSPDNHQFAFLSDTEHPGQQQVYVFNVNTNSTRKITNLNGLISSPRWSPDGKNIAILFTENLLEDAGPSAAQTSHSGVIKDSYYEQRLAIVNISSGKLRKITPNDLFVYEYDWTPDGKQLVFTGAKGNGNNNWFIAKLFAVDISSEKMRTLYNPPLQIGRPSVSPDGKNVAFIMGLNSDAVVIGGDVYVISLAGTDARNITLNRKATASYVTWTQDGNIIDVENMDGKSSIIRINYSNGKIDSLFNAESLISSGSFTPSISISQDGKKSAFSQSSFTKPPEIWAGETGKWLQITSKNVTIKPTWGEIKNLHWRNKDFTLQGWLIYPQNFDPSKKYPMIVDVHGGPSYGIQSSWPNIYKTSMALPAKGYFIFFPNPRGSFGNTQAFTQSNKRDFGYGDWQDIISGIDEVLRIAPVDSKRLGITGWSYGGYMTMWGVTQSDRFKAAIAGAGVSNWISYYGENSIDQWMIPFFGKSMYDDPEIYARSSPITFIKNVKTPTLIIAAEGDGECPVPQSYEFWHALKTLGVPTELVVYKNEGHHFTNPENMRDVIHRTTVWFDRYLKSPSDKTTSIVVESNNY